jgi:putative tricarboxylic transport membrane protein
MYTQKLSSLFWLTLGILICIGSFRLNLGSFRNPGPGFLPFICGALLAGLSFVYFLQEGRSRDAKVEKKPFIVDRRRTWKAALTLITFLVYAIGMEYLGFFVSTIIFLIFLFWVVASQRWYVVIFGSILTSVATYIVFGTLLNSPLPKGIFEF